MKFLLDNKHLETIIMLRNLGYNDSEIFTYIGYYTPNYVRLLLNISLRST